MSGSCRQRGRSSPAEPSHVSPRRACSPGFWLPRGFFQPYPFMTPFPNLPPHPGACASLLGTWEKPTYLFKPDREGVSGLREDVKRMFLPGSAQTAAVLRMGPYRKCKSCCLLLPWTSPKIDLPAGTHGDLHRPRVVGTHQSFSTALASTLTSFPGNGKPEPISIPALCFL